MKTYVLIFSFMGYVSGGPIYDTNKIKYLKERGWTVNVLSVGLKRNLIIKSLKEYCSPTFPELTQYPFYFSKRKRNLILDDLISNIKLAEGDSYSDVIIETGTDYTAFWGELIAKKLKAKHIIMFLDEKNPNVNKDTFEFYKFKYNRGELASISLKSLKFIFEPYFEIKNSNEHILSACCTNTVADIQDDIINKIPLGDYTIGSIGRLEKDFVENIVDGICTFAKSVPDKKVAVSFFGGFPVSMADKINKLKEELKAQNNIQFFISGYIWPIPKDIFKNFDVFISGAGSARVSANQNIPTIKMDVINNQPEGIYYDLKNYLSKKIEGNTSVADYLKSILIEKKYPKIIGKETLEEEWIQICQKFDLHMKFLLKSSNKKEYFSTDSLWVKNKKNCLKKLVFSIIPYKKYIQFRQKCKKTT